MGIWLRGKHCYPEKLCFESIRHICPLAMNKYPIDLFGPNSESAFLTITGVADILKHYAILKWGRGIAT